MTPARAARSRAFAVAATLAAVAFAAALTGCGGRKRVPLPDGAAPQAGGSATGPQTGDAGAGAAPLLLRVGLVDGAASLTLTAEGETQILDGATRRRLARLPAGAACAFEPGRGGVRWRGGGRRATNPSPLILQPVDPDHGLLWEGAAYRGEMRVLATPGGLTLVDVVDLETYLCGVVPWEIGRPGAEGLAALQAQAVAARTYAVAHLGERDADGCDVWADVRDQVYRGRYGADDWCDRAVADTRGVVLKYDGAPIEAYYCSTCGGRTSSIAEVWPREPRPYLGSHSDLDPHGRPWCADSPHAAWTDAWSAADLEHVLATSLPAYLDWLGRSPARLAWAGDPFTPSHPGADPRRPGSLSGLEIVSRTTSGRVARLDVTTAAGVYHVRGDRVRWVLVPVEGRFSALRSAWFDLSVDADGSGRPRRVVVKGRGFGHGIGLCQTGALAMARAGLSFRDILDHSYPGAVLAPLSSP